MSTNPLVTEAFVSDQVEHHEEETDSLAAAMSWAEPGDLVIMLALGGAAPILKQVVGAARGSGFSRDSCRA